MDTERGIREGLRKEMAEYKEAKEKERTGKRVRLHTLQRQNAENLKQIFPEKEYRGLSPNFHIPVSVSELYIPTMGLPMEEIWSNRTCVTRACYLPVWCVVGFRLGANVQGSFCCTF